MLVTRKNYDVLMKEYLEEDRMLCGKVMRLFADCGTDYINMGSVGNSIASGYSKCDEMLPFFARSQILEHEGRIAFYTFARVRRNEEINVLKWYSKNLTHRDMNTLLMSDILAKKGKYAGFDDGEKNLYERMAGKSDIGFRDYVHLKNNIMIYGGLSETFTDIVRKGDCTDIKKLLNCFRNDFEHLKMFLTQAWMDNPKLQVYVCGLPDIMGIGVTNMFDKYIRKAVLSVPNAVYVKGAARNYFSMLDGQKEIDYHYSKPEYLQLICNVWKSILDKYIILKYKTDVLHGLTAYNKRVELNDTTSKGNSGIIRQLVRKYAEKYKGVLTLYNIDEQKIKREIWEFYNRNYLEHFGCTDRKAAAKWLLS